MSKNLAEYLYEYNSKKFALIILSFYKMKILLNLLMLRKNNYRNFLIK